MGLYGVDENGQLLGKDDVIESSEDEIELSPDFSSAEAKPLSLMDV